jgi:hypothetical protein
VGGRRESHFSFKKEEGRGNRVKNCHYKGTLLVRVEKGSSAPNIFVG